MFNFLQNRSSFMKKYKKTIVLAFMAVFMMHPVHAMFLYNYIFPKSETMYTNSGFLVKDGWKEETGSMKVESFSDVASSETKADIYSFLVDGKKMIMGFGNDFNKLNEFERKQYFDKKLIKYGCVDNKTVGIILCIDKKSNDKDEEHLFEIFSCGSLYRIELRTNILKEYENCSDLVIDIPKSLSENKELSNVKTHLEFLRLSVKFSKK